ncbi:MAG: hypothetical protein JXQ91_01675 [Vannielia sp.]|nr:hypothetical protein [Oceanicola sp. 502str15]MCO6382362.1 hypothetical protein [Oceanicola sp. 502str15]
MNSILSQIWRTIVMQFSNQARHSINSKLSQGMNSAQNGLMGKGKKDDE